jgi:hypothetical protein
LRLIHLRATVKCGFGAATFLVATLSAGLAIGQTLTETLDWLREFVLAEGVVANDDGTRGFTHRLENEVCRVTLRRHTSAAPRITRTQQYLSQQFDLKDIDPTRVVVDVHFRPGGWGGSDGSPTNLVRLRTLNERPLITALRRITDPSLPNDWIDSASPDETRRVDILLRTSDAAERVARAFRHAVTLCGGKASPF